MKSILLTFIFAFLFGLNAGLAQQENVEQLLENLSEFSDNHELIELLNELQSHPLNLNRVSADDLKALPWISDVLAAKIVAYRQKHGDFHSLDDLEKIPEFDPNLVPILSDYLTINKPTEKRSLSLELRSRIFRKIQQSQGYRDGSYYPSPEKIYNRIIINGGEKIRAGGLLEKDAGEKNLADFQSYFLEYSPRPAWKIVLGNYLLEFAQGLVFWNPYARYKSSNPIYSAKKRGRLIRPYRLVDENASLRGIASQFCAKFYQIAFFASSQTLDANIDRNSDRVTNFYTAGYHRTENERAKKDQLQEQLFGSRLQITPQENLSVGLTGYFSRFNREFTVANAERYRFGFRGKRNQVFGLDANWIFGDWNFFSEYARSENGGSGVVAGAVFDTRTVDLAVLFRRYSRDFHSFHGSGFGEHGGELQNERGLYFGIRFKPLKNLILSLYQDQFVFPWRTYSLPEPANGADYLAVVEYRPLRRMKIYAHFKHASKPRTETVRLENGNRSEWVVARKQSNLRFQFEFRPTSDLKLRFRWEKNWVAFSEYPAARMTSPVRFHGALLYQEINYRWRPRLTFSTRFSFFDSDDFESRLYQFERDVPGVLTNQMLYGQGSRWYLVCHYKIAAFASVSIKFSETHYYYRSTIGSQADLINGDQLSAVAIQCQSRW
ncbi:MAG: helix-hairpin-helix domain-containing protein [Calditrichaeota bacterium]|nr:helix-hairpin-helix domain-containing protein [Calditrichota bacterium]